jgi:hypothetical protein
MTKPLSIYDRIDHTKASKFENRSASKILVAVCIRYAPVIGFELRCAGAPIETRLCWTPRGGNDQRRPEREDYSTRTIGRSAPVPQNPRSVNVQRDEFSLFTSKFESYMASHAVSLPDVSRRDASRAGAGALISRSAGSSVIRPFLWLPIFAESVPSHLLDAAAARIGVRLQSRCLGIATSGEGDAEGSDLHIIFLHRSAAPYANAAPTQA